MPHPRLNKPAAFIRTLLLLLPLSGSMTVFAQNDAALPIERVVLSTAGVGYFQHGGTVSGDARVTLDFTPSQLNDLLKSLVIQDFDGGSVAGVDYPGSEPLSRLLGELSIDLSSNRSLPELFVQLRGSDARISLDGGETVSGRILGVEKRQRAAGQTRVEVELVSIVGADGVRAIEIDNIRHFSLNDPRLQEQLNKALNALAESGNNDKKPISVRFDGNGRRRVALGYVVEAPLWKTSYRLSLPAEGAAATPALQGWAIVENNTANDWQNIELALVSGRPLSFIEDLYQSQYLTRPVHKPQRFASLAPQMYDSGLDMMMEEAVAEPAAQMKMSRNRATAPAPTAMFSSAADYASSTYGGSGMTDIADSVRNAAATENLGATFRYVIPAVDLPSRRSAMLPIVNEGITAVRVSIYDRAALASHPLHGVKLTNDTGKHLPGGPLTVLEGNSYAGDARIDDLPAGGEKLLSFAVDLEMKVQQREAAQENVLRGARIENGVLYVQEVRSRSTAYAIRNEDDSQRQLLLAHPLDNGWALADTAEPVERTENQYRFALAVAAGETKTFTVTEQRTDWESVGIADVNEFYLAEVSANTRLPQKVRDAVARAVELQRAVAAAAREIETPQQRIQEITTEQERIRANLQAVQPRTPLHNRLIQRLETQESELEQLQSALFNAREKHQAAKKALNDYLAGLTVE